MSKLKDILEKKYDLSKIEKIFLIRSSKINDGHIAKINSKYKYEKGKTLIVRFNLNINHKLFNNVTDLRIVRGHLPHVNHDYSLKSRVSPDNTIIITLQNKEHIKNSNKFEEVYSMIETFDKNIQNGTNCYHYIAKKYNTKYTNKQFNHRVRGKMNSIPTIGFITLMNLLNIFPNAKFYLCGFTFQVNGHGKYVGWNGHDGAFEKFIYDNYLTKNVFLL